MEKKAVNEIYLREQVEKLLREVKIHKARADALEKENQSLKKSLYEQSIQYNASKKTPFSLTSIDFGITPTPLFEDENESFNGNNSLPQNLPKAAESLVSGLASGSSTNNISSDSGDPSSLDGSTIKSQFPKDGKVFGLKHDFQGHSAAVYSVQFSACGKFLASGSFDKTVRIWDTTAQTEPQVLKKHSLNVSDLGWFRDSSEMISGAYDQTCKVWDVATGKLADSIDCDGFVQSVMFHPNEKSLVFYGTSRNNLCMVDRRTRSQPPGNSGTVTFKNDAMINSLYVYRDATYVLSADSQGCLKTWDIRTSKCVHAHQSAQGKKVPISHIAMSFATADDEEPRLLAVNSYDNVMRVYERGFNYPKFNYKVIHTLKGHKNKNWPIKSNFFYTKDSTMFTKRAASHEDLYSNPDAQESLSESGFDKERSGSTTLLATGSADPFVFVYNISGGEGSSELLQRLEGHTDRVYAVNFHPSEPVLASCSADFTVKIWGIGGSNGRKKN